MIANGFMSSLTTKQKHGLSFNPKGGMKQNESSLFNLSPSLFPSLITAYSSLRSSQSPEQRIRYQILEQLPDLKALNPLAS